MNDQKHSEPKPVFVVYLFLWFAILVGGIAATCLKRTPDSKPVGRRSVVIKVDYSGCDEGFLGLVACGAFHNLALEDPLKYGDEFEQSERAFKRHVAECEECQKALGTERILDVTVYLRDRLKETKK